MSKKKHDIKNDILYLFILILLTEYFNYTDRANTILLITTGLLGLVLLETWFIRIFQFYSSKKISQYSDVLVKISLKNRFFSYFVLPALFYISLLVFLYFNRNILLGYFALGVSMCLILVMFLNVKSSFNKVYSIESNTRAIFDFLCITIFYLLLNVFIRLGLGLEIFLISIGLSALILFLFVLKLHDRLGMPEFLVSIFSTLVVVAGVFLVWNTNVFVIPAVGSLAFYLLVSMWNIRFSGKIYLVDYLIPFIYVLLALILIFNI